MNYEIEIPYLEQTKSWKEGMKYLYSPDCYPIIRKQYKRLNDLGPLAGLFLEQQNPNSKFIEFRLDLVKDFQDNLWVTELQTDDRGLPAITSARNAKGYFNSTDLLPGVSPTLAASLSELAGKNDFSLLITFPEEERFYYSGFYDLRSYLLAENPKSEIVVTSKKDLTFQGEIARINIPYAGLISYTNPDLIWDFTQEIRSSKIIQPMITKQFLLDVWNKDNPTALALRNFIPKAMQPIEIILKDKNGYIIKPITGKWSKGVVIGQWTSIWDWKQVLSSPNVLAQEYISSPSEIFSVRIKNGNLVQRPFYSRIEGYYVKSSGNWKLADILATCTPTIPVHGQRECIMIPAIIKK